MVRSTRRPSGSKMSCDTRSISAPARSRMSAARSITASSRSIRTDLAGDRRRAGARELVRDQRERLRLVVAHRDQLVAGQDEGDRRGFRRGGVGLAHQRRRHVARAVLQIEPARDLDLLHLLARRHRDAERAFEQLVLGDASESRGRTRPRPPEWCRLRRSPGVREKCRAGDRRTASARHGRQDSLLPSAPARRASTEEIMTAAGAMLGAVRPRLLRSARSACAAWRARRRDS